MKFRVPDKVVYIHVSTIMCTLYFHGYTFNFKLKYSCMHLRFQNNVFTWYDCNIEWNSIWDIVSVNNSNIV